MDLTALQTQTRKLIGSPDVNQVANSVLTEAINLAYKHITTRYKHKLAKARVALNTIAGTYQYADARFSVVWQVWSRIRNYKLTKITDRGLVHNDNTTSQPTVMGFPKMWYSGASATLPQLSLFPVPDSTYELEVICKPIPVDLSAGTDVPIVNELWHPGISRLARWYYHDQETLDYVKAEQAYASWQRWMSDKSNEVHEETESTEQGVVLPHLLDRGSSSRLGNRWINPFEVDVSDVDGPDPVF